MASLQRRRERVEDAPRGAETRDEEQQRPGAAFDRGGQHRAVSRAQSQRLLGHAASVCAIMRDMPRFFVDSAAVSDGTVRLAGDDAAHLARSLRARRGEHLIVVEDGRHEHSVVITEITPEHVTGTIEWTRAATGESALAVHVLQSIPARGMDEAIEALSIAGAHTIHPVVTERTVTRADASASARRASRWNAIAREAAQLAGRARAPEVKSPQPLGAALSALPPRCRILACVAHVDATPLRAVKLERSRPVACVIGPEGGLGERDLAELGAAGASPVHMGQRIFPSRLAGCIAVSLLLAGNDDLESPPAPYVAAGSAAS
jgi:16S rRNA (uracil1498-N3)-methyltransferase